MSYALDPMIGCNEIMGVQKNLKAADNALIRINQ